ncbi:MAG: hypothetical protein IJ642_00720 [Oscillospiraceae bacterium]|nr:hypothetical protein [Oscillospiraceae bacterium]
MLFIQIIHITYTKNSRSGEKMHQINHIRFKEIPALKKDLSAGEICICNNSNTRTSVNIFPYQENFNASGALGRAFVHKQDENYQIFYSDRPALPFSKPVFTLAKNQYGRIIYNERYVTYDSEWYYTRTILNFLHADSSAYKTKLFFRKEPDFLFQDLKWLRYCGTYHKRRITNAR